MQAGQENSFTWLRMQRGLEYQVRVIDSLSREMCIRDSTRTEIAEIITHIGFYAGWPKAWAAFNLAKGVWAENSAGEDAKAAFQREMIFPIGEPNTAYAQYFTGNSYLAPVSRERVNISNVTFEPRCRNNWHIQHATEGGGQMLIGVAGRCV